MLTKEQKTLIKKLLKKHSVYETKVILEREHGLKLAFRTVQYWGNPKRARAQARKYFKRHYHKVDLNENTK